MNRYDSTYVYGARQKFYGTTKYPIVPLSFRDIYVFTQEEDRYDQLAQEYYGDSKYWWVIAWYNQRPTEASIKTGQILLVPTPLERVLELAGY